MELHRHLGSSPCCAAGIEREQEKIKRDAKEAARKGEKAVVKAMAKNIVMSNKAIERMHVTKANLNSVLVTLQTQGGKLRAGQLHAAHREPADSAAVSRRRKPARATARMIISGPPRLASSSNRCAPCAFPSVQPWRAWLV